MRRQLQSTVVAKAARKPRCAIELAQRQSNGVEAVVAASAEVNTHERASATLMVGVPPRSSVQHWAGQPTRHQPLSRTSHAQACKGDEGEPEGVRRGMPRLWGVCWHAHCRTHMCVRSHSRARVHTHTHKHTCARM